MKKLISVILCLVMLLSLAACQPAENPTDPTDAPTDPTDDIVVGGDPTDAPTDPTDAPTDPTDPPAPAVLAANGVCAVGIVDTAAGTAKILADNGVVAEIPYSCEGDPIPGQLYEFAKNGDVYTLTAIAYINPDVEGACGAWGVRTYDNSGMGTPDQLFTHDGTYGRLYTLTEDCVIFVRYSETEYRVFSGSDAIKYSDWPCYMHFRVNPVDVEVPDADGMIYDAGTCDLIFVVGDVTQGKPYADEAGSYFFDNEGFGWPDGDLIIE